MLIKLFFEDGGISFSGLKLEVRILYLVALDPETLGSVKLYARSFFPGIGRHVWSDPLAAFVYMFTVFDFRLIRFELSS